MRRVRTICGLAAGLLLSSALVSVQAAEFVEGTDYLRLPVAVETGSEQVEVVEVFSYACIHCYNFDPILESWLEPRSESLNFVRLPAIFSPDWELLAQAFYTAETLGVRESVHKPIFDGIHKARQDLRRPDLLAELFAEHADVSSEDFNAAYNSFSVRSRVQQAKARTRAYRVTGVPSLVVNGKYLVDGQMAKGNGRMLQVVDYLVGLEQPTAGGE